MEHGVSTSSSLRMGCPPSHNVGSMSDRISAVASHRIVSATATAMCLIDLINVPHEVRYDLSSVLRCSDTQYVFIHLRYMSNVKFFSF